MIAIRFQFVPYLWVSLLLTALMITLIVYTWRNRTVMGSRYFLLTLALVEIWILAQALEMAAIDLPAKLIWANIQYIPIILTPVTYFYLTLQFTGHNNWLQARWLHILLLLIPIAFNLLAWTNDMHGLIRQNIYLDYSGSFPTVGKTYGPLFWVFAVYNYAINLSTIVILLNAYKEKVLIYRKQITFLLIALLFPVLTNLLYTTKIIPSRIDATPSVFGLSALIISWGIFRYRLFDVIPIARSIIIQEMKIGMIVLDEKGRFLDINPAARKMLGFTSDLCGLFIEKELQDFPDLIRIFQEGKEKMFEMLYQNNDINYYYEGSFTKIKDKSKQPIGWLLQIYDITERKIAEEIIQYAAFHDDLTGLPNRCYFQVLFTQELAHARMRRDFLTVAFLDLDNFKTINDTYGHEAGDRALCQVANRLKTILRTSDIISRIGGDEFAIIFPHIGNDETIQLIGNKILDMFENTIDLNEIPMQVKASLGFSVYPRDGDNIDALLRKADKAMYMVKGNDKDNYLIYKE